MGSLGEVLIQITLADPDRSFTIDQAAVTDGDQEVKFGVRIDTDDDISTGDAGGYDLDVAFLHFSDSLTASPSTVTLAEAANNYTTYGFNSIPVPYTALLIGNDLLFETGEYYLEEYFTDISPTAKSQFYAEYYEPAKTEDTVSVITGSGEVNDPAGDVPGYEFLDIIYARIDF